MMGRKTKWQQNIRLTPQNPSDHRLSPRAGKWSDGAQHAIFSHPGNQPGNEAYYGSLHESYNFEKMQIKIPNL